MPIDQTLRGLALEIDASTDPAPETPPLLEYRFIDLASTQTILARIKGIPQPNGRGQLAFETNAGSATTTQRMLIDNNGSIGIGTGNPRAKLDVVGDAKFGGPLSIQGTLTVDSGAHVGGDLSVTGKLTANSFAGDGAELNNLTPADNSVSSAKLTLDAASLGKVSDGKIVVQGDSVAIRGRLVVEGVVKFQGSGSTTPGSTNWQPYEGTIGIYLDVDTSAGRFTTTPKYFTSLGGNSSHWATTGVTSIYTPSPTGFRVYVRWSDGSALTPAQANSLHWHVNWLGVEA
jgi:phage baseplate assembly protein gpV